MLDILCLKNISPLPKTTTTKQKQHPHLARGNIWHFGKQTKVSHHFLQTYIDRMTTALNCLTFSNAFRENWCTPTKGSRVTTRIWTPRWTSEEPSPSPDMVEQEEPQKWAQHFVSSNILSQDETRCRHNPPPRYKGCAEKYVPIKSNKNTTLNL